MCVNHIFVPGKAIVSNIEFFRKNSNNNNFHDYKGGIVIFQLDN